MALPSFTDLLLADSQRRTDHFNHILSRTVIALHFSLCESCFICGSPLLQGCSSSGVLTESPGSLSVSSPGFWLPVLIFSKYKATESSVQLLSYSASTETCKRSLLWLLQISSCRRRKAVPTVGLPSLSFLSLQGLGSRHFFSPVLWACQELCSASQPLSLVRLMKKPVSGGEKQLGISDSLLCISLLSKTLAFTSWLHWELANALTQVVLFYPSFLVVLGRLLVWSKLVHHYWRWT